MTDDEAQKLRDERARYRDLWLHAADERDALAEKLAERDEMLEQAQDREDLAWEHAEFWREHAALVKLEVERLTAREPRRRGRPPSWSPDSEAEVERRHRGGASIREIAAELHASKTQVHRVIVRVRQQHAEAAERARLIAIADGRSLTQRDARAAKQPNAIRSRTTTPPVSSEPASGYGSP
jgi:hypothetical protein